ncbi:hypothetical protein R1flu_013365 [Riccia fluitans]|uniref:Uncharacterized protein n=1 Tax=Riccia fluitans TaxID=41844 RepID=A0ABD1YE66_9MARC
MAPRNSKNLKTKEVKIPHLTVSNRRKMESWGLGGFFAVDWSGTYDHLVEESVTKKKTAGPKFEYHGKPEEWISEVWREVYNLPKANPRGYVMKGKIQFTELQSLKVVKSEHRQSKSGVFLEQIEGNSDFKEASKKRKAAIQTVCDSNTETKPEEEKESPKEVPRAFCEGEESGSKPLDLKLNFAKLGNHVVSFSRETGRLLEAFHVEFGSMTAEVVARNLKEMSTPPPIVETDLQLWKEMVKTLVDLLTEEQKKIKLVVE